MHFLNTRQIRQSIVLLLMLIWVLCPAETPRYSIEKKDNQWQLFQNGSSFYIKGAVGWSHYDVLEAYGANSVRTQAKKELLDKAHEHGFTARAGLPVRGERNGMDWADPKMVAKQKERVLDRVREFKDHPAVMLWNVGNELDWIPPGVPHHPDLWQRLNDLAKAIKAVDPHHPVMTVVGSGRFEKKIQRIMQDCPDIDLLGINTYGDIAEVTQQARQFWNRPYIIAEWGPTGHWQVPKTMWGAPVEQTSTEKAHVIFDRYQNIILQDRKHCLGSYVFYWGEKQETTHTWYGLFRDGLITESIDVMHFLWKDSWPQNRAPAVLNVIIDEFVDEKAVLLNPGQTCQAQAFCYDSDYDSLTFVWDIRPEVEVPEDSYAGGGEEPAKPIPGLFTDSHARRVRFQAPDKNGAYRLFVQITDGHGHAGYANVPFYVGTWSK